jgi:hypothetical protein
MKLKKGFVLRDVCGDKVIVGEGLEEIDFGRLLSLNEVAAWLWEEATKLSEFTIQSLAEALCNEYNVSSELATKDVTNIVKKWQEMNMVED